MIVWLNLVLGALVVVAASVVCGAVYLALPSEHHSDRLLQLDDEDGLAEAA